MKSFILLIIGLIAAILILGGASALYFVHELGVNVEDVDSNSVNDVLDKVSDVTSSGNSGSSSGENSGNIVDDIVNEEVKFNHQNGEGYYREVTYKDGGFRQYDTESGDLIGSSYESDQDKLPSME